MTTHLSSASLANLVRLHAPAAPASVLCVSADPEALASGFEGWIPRIVRHRAREPEIAEAIPSGPFHAAILLTSGAVPDLLPVATSVVRGGLIAVGVPGVPPRAVERVCRRAGLHTVVRYRVSPSLERPLYLVPDETRAWTPYLAIRAPQRGWRGAARRVGLALGWRPRDHRDALVLALVP